MSTFDPHRYSTQHERCPFCHERSAPISRPHLESAVAGAILSNFSFQIAAGVGGTLRLLLLRQSGMDAYIYRLTRAVPPTLTPNLNPHPTPISSTRILTVILPLTQGDASVRIFLAKGSTCCSA